MWRKACPRCHGDLFVERFLGGDEVTCLQCGYSPPEAVIAQIKAALARRKAGHPAAQPVAVPAGRVA